VSQTYRHDHSVDYRRVLAGLDSSGGSFFMLMVLQEGSKVARQQGVGLAGGGSSKSLFGW